MQICIILIKTTPVFVFQIQILNLTEDKKMLSKGSMWHPTKNSEFLSQSH